MTAFGKLLVFVQFILSMVFTTWAVALYSERIDWVQPKTMLGDPIEDSKGRLAELDDEIKKFVIVDDKDKDASRDKAEFRWQTAFSGLTRATTSRENYQKWYADQLSLAKKGEDTDGRRLDAKEPAVRQLVYNPDGTFKMDPKDRPPVKSFDTDVKSVEYYDTKSEELRRAIDTAQDLLVKTVEEAARVTEEIVGSPTKFGLRRELRDENAYYLNALDEYLYLEPIRNGRTAELEVVKKRNAQLEARKRELTAAAANR